MSHTTTNILPDELIINILSFFEGDELINIINKSPYFKKIVENNITILTNIFIKKYPYEDILWNTDKELSIDELISKLKIQQFSINGETEYKLTIDKILDINYVCNSNYIPYEYFLEKPSREKLLYIGILYNVGIVSHFIKSICLYFCIKSTLTMNMEGIKSFCKDVIKNPRILFTVILAL
jgi:hypothetical protein